MHILTLLAMNRDDALTSEFVAGSVQTNPVVIRRILGRLREAGFVTAVQGPGGGFLLAGDPARLTLKAVYEAVSDRTVIAVHPEGNPRCPVGRNIGQLLETVIAGAQESMLASLDGITVATLARRVAKCEKAG